MDAAPRPFTGFTKDTLRFLANLKKNNDRAWFEAHRAGYERDLLAPAMSFVVAMGERLRAAVPGIVAVPRVDKSIFRLNRDTRFSLDPAPYKTNLGIYFWEGRSRFEGVGFYFHLEPPEMIVGGGMYGFPKEALPRYRAAAADPARGRRLAAIVEELRGLGFEVGGAHYKRVPAGYPADHFNAALLKHDGLYAGETTKIPDLVFSARLLDHCQERYERMLPLHRWLSALMR